MATIANAFKQTATSVLNGVLSAKTKGNVTSVEQVKNPKAIINTVINKASSKVGSVITNPVLTTVKNTTVPKVTDVIKQEAMKVATPTVTSAASKVLSKVSIPNVFSTPVNNNTTSVASSIFRRGTQTFSSETLGYEGDFGRDDEVSSGQLITINIERGSGSTAITGKLQKDFSLSISSEWEPLVPPMSEFEEYSKKFQVASSLVGMQASLGSPLTSRRIWKGTSPVSINLDIHFMCVNEGKARKEVVSPCVTLQSLILPSYGDSKLFNLLPVLRPPGPNPLALSLTGRESLNDGGEQITIRIGGMFTMSPVIVKSVNVTFDNKLDANGLPMSAKASIVFETYQVIVKEELKGFFGEAANTAALSGATVQTAAENYETAKASSNTTVTSPS